MICPIRQLADETCARFITSPLPKQKRSPCKSRSPKWRKRNVTFNQSTSSFRYPCLVHVFPYIAIGHGLYHHPLAKYLFLDGMVRIDNVGKLFMTISSEKNISPTDDDIVHALWRH